MGCMVTMVTSVGVHKKRLSSSMNSYIGNHATPSDDINVKLYVVKCERNISFKNCSILMLASLG